MAGSPFATTGELAAGWRVLTAAEEEAASVLLADASYWLRVWYPELDLLDDLSGAAIVVRSMVKRALLASDVEGVAAANTSESVGPWSHAQSRTYRNPDGALYLTQRETELLSRITGRPGATGAASVTARGF